MPTITVIIICHQHLFNCFALLLLVEVTEGCRNVRKFVTLLASVNKPQSCQNYVPNHTELFKHN